jgi:hypothetical protein
MFIPFPFYSFAANYLTMKKFVRAIAIAPALALSLLMVSCGSEKEGDGGEEGGGGSCSEKNAITMSIGSEADLASMEVKKVFAMKSGWSVSGGKKKVRYMVYLANYEARLSSFGLDMPQNDGEYVVEVSVNGKMVEADAELIQLEAGKYAFGSSLDENAALSVAIYKKGAVVPAFQYTNNVTGEIEITNLSDKTICGSFNITDTNGDKMSGSFSAPIEKDISGDF